MTDSLPPKTHNNPPTPFDDARDAVSTLKEEALNWLDGAEVTSQDEADAIAKLLDMARKVKKQADDARKAEAKPFDDGKKEVQARYKPLIDDCDRISDVCKEANRPYLLKLEEQRRLEAEAARIKAEEEAERARAALHAAELTDLAAKEAAEEQAEIAKNAAANAKKAAQHRAHAKGGTKAMSLRTNYTHEITDAQAFARWCWVNENPALMECLNSIAKRRVANKWRDMPGISIYEEKVPV